MFGSILSWQCCISLNIDTKSPSVKLKIFVSSHYKAEFDLFKKPPTQTQEPYTPMFVNKALLVFYSGLCWRAPNPSFNPHKAPKERGKKSGQNASRQLPHVGGCGLFYDCTGGCLQPHCWRKLRLEHPWEPLLLRRLG